MNISGEAGTRRNLVWIEPAIIILILLVVVEAEWLSAKGGQLSCLLLDAGAIFVGINAYLFSPALPHRRVFLAILLLPLLRILSLTVPVRAIPQLAWYAVIGIPMGIATILVAWATRLPWSWVIGRENLQLKQFLFGLIGIPAGIILYSLSQPSPIPVQGNPILVTAGIVIFILVTAVFEEVMFRFVLQINLIEVFGFLGIFLCALIYASMSLGTQIKGGILAPALIGLVFSFWTSRTRSIWGAAMAHSILNFLVFLILPLSLHP